MFDIFDINGNRIECRVLFTFNHDNKNFIVYINDTEDVMASFYKIENEKMIITPITDDKDFDIVDDEILKRCSENE